MILIKSYATVLINFNNFNKIKVTGDRKQDYAIQVEECTFNHAGSII